MNWDPCDLVQVRGFENEAKGSWRVKKVPPAGKGNFLRLSGGNRKEKSLKEEVRKGKIVGVSYGIHKWTRNSARDPYAPTHGRKR